MLSLDKISVNIFDNTGNISDPKHLLHFVSFWYFENFQLWFEISIIFIFPYCDDDFWVFVFLIYGWLHLHQP